MRVIDHDPVVTVKILRVVNSAYYSLPKQITSINHAVAGFGRIETMDADEVFPSADEMINLQESAIQHMNEDHADAIQRYAESLGATPGGWQVAGIDPDGADLLRGEEVLRLSFPAPVCSAAELRGTFAKLGQRS